MLSAIVVVYIGILNVISVEKSRNFIRSMYNGSNLHLTVNFHSILFLINEPRILTNILSRK